MSAKRKKDNINTNDSDKWFNKGVVFVKLGKYDAAIKCFDKAIEINPNDSDTWLNKGATLAKIGKYDYAIKCFDKAIEINHDDAKTWFNKGVVLGNIGNHDAAIKCFDKAIEINPDYSNSWCNKGTSLFKIRKYNDAIKCFEKAIKINHNDYLSWYNKGILLIEIEKHDDAIKCFEKAIKINPDYSDAWFNKGAVFVKLGKYDDAIKCFEKAIKINPDYADAWINKGIELGNLGKHDDAIKCFEKAIEINPDYAGAYFNLGITLLDLHKYDEAQVELKRAEEIFNVRGSKDYEDKSHILVLLAENASELMSKMRSLDELFMECLNSNSLFELKDKSIKLSRGIRSLVKRFDKKVIPEDVNELLNSKKICYTALSDAVRFKKVDYRILDDAKNVFEKWGLDNFVTSVNSLDSFIRGLSKYKNIKEIPNNLEVPLLRVLSTAYYLDGILTEEMSDRIKGEPLKTKLSELEREIEIKFIQIKNINKDSIKVCIVQLCFQLTKKFPYRLENKIQVKGKILKALKLAYQQGVEIICFPELSFDKDFIEEVKKCNERIIICGSYYDNYNFNRCSILVKDTEYIVFKIAPSPILESEISPGTGMKSGSDMKIFGTEDDKFRFGVLICNDYLANVHRFYNYNHKGKKGVNFIFNPSLNKDIERFQRKGDSDCENWHYDIIQVNTAEYGGSCIIGTEHKTIIERHIDEGNRKKDNIKYKICDADGEMMLIADIKLKGVEVPPSLDAEPRIKLIGSYKYQNEQWKLIN